MQRSSSDHGAEAAERPAKTPSSREATVKKFPDGLLHTRKIWEGYSNSAQAKSGGQVGASAPHTGSASASVNFPAIKEFCNFLFATGAEAEIFVNDTRLERALYRKGVHAHSAGTAT